MVTFLAVVAADVVVMVLTNLVVLTVQAHKVVQVELV
jgi:hypothetical protein